MISQQCRLTVVYLRMKLMLSKVTRGLLTDGRVPRTKHGGHIGLDRLFGWNFFGKRTQR
jgi:hypothetical protein